MNLDIANRTIFAGLQIPHNAHFADCENNKRQINCSLPDQLNCPTKQSIKDKYSFNNMLDYDRFRTYMNANIRQWWRRQ